MAVNLSNSPYRHDPASPLFHGSRSDVPITAFRTKYGAYFTTDREYAETVMEAGRIMGSKCPRLYQVDVTLERPELFDGESQDQFDAFTQHRELSQDVEARGYDGQLMVFADGHFDVRVNHPEQVRIVSVQPNEQV